MFGLILRTQLTRTRAQNILKFGTNKIDSDKDRANSTTEKSRNILSSLRYVRLNRNFHGKMSSNYHISLAIAPEYYGFIIGAKGAKVIRIQEETHTTVKIPRGNSGNIEITGETQEDVDAARREIESIVASSRLQIRVNHFTNARFADETIKNNFEIFMKEVLADGSVDGLTEAMFTRPEKLHITINVMTLLDENDFARATQALNECVKVINPVKNEFGKIDVKISGVRVFDDVNPSKVKVVFGNIESAALQKIADGIMEYFIVEGVSKRERNGKSVKMHLTLIKTDNDKGQSDTDENGDQRPAWRRRAPRKFIDATSILAKYAEYEFGAQEVTEILLSAMGEKDSDGYYKTVASVTF